MTVMFAFYYSIKHFSIFLMLPFLLSKLQFVLDVEWELNQEFLFGENHRETIILIYNSYMYSWISLEINL